MGWDWIRCFFSLFAMQVSFIYAGSRTSSLVNCSLNLDRSRLEFTEQHSKPKMRFLHLVPTPPHSTTMTAPVSRLRKGLNFGTQDPATVVASESRVASPFQVSLLLPPPLHPR
jgi:hypothetical protein